MNIKQILGNNIKRYRKKAEMTQDELAEKLDISTKHLSNIEIGQKFVSAELLEKIYRELKVSPAALFYSAELDGLGDDTLNRIGSLIAENAEALKTKIREEI